MDNNNEQVNIREGFGLMKYKDAEFHGFFRKDKRSRFGTYIYKNGNIYSGDICGGYGMFKSVYGTTYYGNWDRNDQACGEGAIVYKTGKTIVEGRFSRNYIRYKSKISYSNLIDGLMRYDGGYY